ncbi:MAG: folate-binding protein [Pseudonocardia sp.]|nr:folate-binding protein [Pseudonocardia sp.]
MTLPDHDLDAAVAAHRGDPLAEQRAMARSAGVVDRSHHGVIVVTGEERLSWLHLLLTQHVTQLPAGTGTEALVLDLNGRVQHHMVVAHAAGTVTLITEPGDATPLLDYLRSMTFWAKVELRDATDELALLDVVGPTTPDVLAAAGLPVPERPHGVAVLPGGGHVHRMPWPGPDAAQVVVARAAKDEWQHKLVEAGARAAGTVAFEAMRVESGRPRFGLDTDDRTIPHEVGWIGSAVHLEKGCYRGQETVARVANLGRPPRMRVTLLLDAGDERLPVPGDPGLRDGRQVGRVGSVIVHHELGPIASALVKRSTPGDAVLVAGEGERAAPARIDPDSIPVGSGAVPPGRAAQMRGGLR